MANAEQNLSHEEMWDDSALVESWNDALQEYKKYHSIHSKGGNVDDILNPEKAVRISDAKEEEKILGPGVKGEETDVRMDETRENGNVQNAHIQPQATGSAFIPAPLLGSVRDEGLKKLLMSWYYAGYYTGLYEGQQSQQQ